MGHHDEHGNEHKHGHYHEEYAHDHHDHHHDHDHEHEHDHGHSHSSNPVIAWLQHLFMPHSHGHQQAALDPNLATDRGMWALKVSLAGLMATAIFQVVIVIISDSVALLADTIHNFSDALTAIPLGLAFWLSRRARNKRYTYGYGRAEDIAGVVIVSMIAYSAFEAIRHAILRFITQPITNLGWVPRGRRSYRQRPLAGSQRFRLVVAKGKPLDVVVTGDPAAAPPNLKPLASFVADLAAYQHPSLRPYRPAFYALRARPETLPGGCREWTFPIAAEQAVAAPQQLAAPEAAGWPTGAQVASACVDEKRYAVTLRPLLPGEKP